MKKNKLLKMISILGISVLAMGMFTGCGADKEASTKPQESKVIVMGTNAEFKPFEYREGTEIVGFDIEISKAIAKKLGKELVIEDMAFGSLISALNNDKIDFIAAGMTVDDEKIKQVDFSQTYFHTKQVIIVKEENNDVATVEDLVGKKVGVQLATTGDTAVSKTKGVEVVRVNKGAQAVMDLQNGKVDAVVIDAEPAKEFIKGQDGLKILDAPFVEEEYAIAVKKGDSELLEAINETFDELKESGEYDKIYAQFFDDIE